MADWCPFAESIPFNHAGTALIRAVPPRGILHTTESLTYKPSRWTYFGHLNPPHFTVTRQGVAYQHYPMSSGARALLHPRGTIETNRYHAYQIEIVGYAKDIANLPGPQLSVLKRLMRWIEGNSGVARTSLYRFLGSEAYGVNSPSRITAQQWTHATGWLGHQHVPNNRHYDPGIIDIHQLLAGGWQHPGDPVDTQADAVAAANYQGGVQQGRTVAAIKDPAAAIMAGRTLDLLMQHDKRLRNGDL